MTTKPEYQSDVKALGAVLDSLSKLDPAARQWVLSTAASRLHVVIAPTPGTAGDAAGAALPAGGVGKLTPKEFLKVKAPISDVDRVACLAFYLTHGRQTASYAARELTAIHIESAGPKINMSRATDNATKQSGYLASAGKGKKQITTHGEDVVNALPDYEKVKEILAAGKGAARKKRAKKKRA